MIQLHPDGLQIMTSDVQMAIVDEVSNMDRCLCVNCCMLQNYDGNLLDEWQVCIRVCFWDWHYMMYFYAPNVSIGA
jgi:hypothetical protein